MTGVWAAVLICIKWVFFWLIWSSVPADVCQARVVLSCICLWLCKSTSRSLSCVVGVHCFPVPQSCCGGLHDPIDDQVEEKRRQQTPQTYSWSYLQNSRISKWRGQPCTSCHAYLEHLNSVKYCRLKVINEDDVKYRVPLQWLPHIGVWSVASEAGHLAWAPKLSVSRKHFKSCKQVAFKYLPVWATCAWFNVVTLFSHSACPDCHFQYDMCDASAYMASRIWYLQTLTLSSNFEPYTSFDRITFQCDAMKLP